MNEETCDARCGRHRCDRRPGHPGLHEGPAMPDNRYGCVRVSWEVSTPEPPGVWVAFNWDGSAFVPFATELEAYRYASGPMMQVKFAKFGDEDWMRN